MKQYKIAKFSLAADYLRSSFDFRINEIKGRTEYKVKNESNWHPIDEYVANNWLLNIKEVADSIRSKFTKSDLNILLNSSEFSDKCNPIIEYFNSVEKISQSNDISEIEKWIKSFRVSRDADLARKYWLSWFNGTMINLMTESYYEHMLVLVGGQGIGKTYAIQNKLCRPFEGYVTDHFSWGTTKDDIVQLATNFIIYDDEFDATGKMRMSAVKSMISRDNVANVRPAYKEFARDFRRISSFIASTNQKNFLTDRSGNRRFLVLTVESIDWERINNINYDLLWSQVWRYYHLGDNKEELSYEKINEVNNSYKVINHEEDVIDRYVDIDNVDDSFYTPYDLVKELCKVNSEIKLDETTTRKVNSILRQKGLDQRIQKINGKSMRVWDVSLKKMSDED